MAGANSASFSVIPADPTNTGSYFVVVTNSISAATSAVATLSVLIPPLIVADPASLTVPAGAAAALSVTASGSTPLTYRWYFRGQLLAGAAGDTLNLPSAASSNAGPYQVVVSNPAGAATSAVATLTVFLPPTLHIQLQGTNVLLAWPAAGGTYQVLSGSALSAAWQPANSPVLTSGATAIVTLPTTSTQQFYRLQRIGP